MVRHNPQSQVPRVGLKSTEALHTPGVNPGEKSAKKGGAPTSEKRLKILKSAGRAPLRNPGPATGIRIPHIKSCSIFSPFNI